MSKENKNVIKQNLIVIFGAIGLFTLAATIMGIVNGDSWFSISFMLVMFLGLAKLIFDAIRTDEEFFNKTTEISEKRRKEHDELIDEYNIPRPLRWFV
jgi:hypothetical protein